MVGSREAFDRASSDEWNIGDLVDMVHEGYWNTETFSPLDAASADYAKRQMDKADADFERAVSQDCPECGSTIIDAQCSNKARHS